MTTLKHSRIPRARTTSRLCHQRDQSRHTSIDASPVAKKKVQTNNIEHSYWPAPPQSSQSCTLKRSTYCQSAVEIPESALPQANRRLPIRAVAQKTASSSVRGPAPIITESVATDTVLARGPTFARTISSHGVGGNMLTGTHIPDTSAEPFAPHCTASDWLGKIKADMLYVLSALNVRRASSLQSEAVLRMLLVNHESNFDDITATYHEAVIRGYSRPSAVTLIQYGIGSIALMVALLLSFVRNLFTPEINLRLNIAAFLNFMVFYSFFTMPFFFRYHPWLGVPCCALALCVCSLCTLDLASAAHELL